MLLTEAEYWKGRDVKYKDELTPEIRANAATTLEKARELIARCDNKARGITSGWRPRSVNAATPGASMTSKHLTGQAIDIADASGTLDQWCLKNQDTLAELGLWLEHPDATQGWCHLQTTPPRSGARVFRP
jgi:hypothetical protein